jgi:fatty acid desaturase
MLRHRADRRTLAFISVYYALFALAWARVPLGSRALAPAIVVLSCVSWFCAVIAHNVVHSPVFRRRWQNRIFQVVLTCAYGFPISEYIPGHNLSHHRYTQKTPDVMRTTKARFLRLNFLNLLVFFPRVGKDVTSQNYRYAARAKKAVPGWHRQLQIEIVACWGVKALFLILDWKRALLLVGVPHLWALWGITTVNFLQHDGCDEDHPYNHSRNFVGKVFNWFTFNNGYHGIHHDEPGLHWSLLADAHAERIHGKIDPRLEQTSLVRYLFATFVYPGTRRRFDGTPVVLPDPAPDGEWIPENIRAVADAATGAALGSASGEA